MATDKSLLVVQSLLGTATDSKNNLITVITDYLKKHSSSSRETTGTFLLDLSKDVISMMLNTTNSVELIDYSKRYLFAIKYVLESQLDGLNKLKGYGTPSFLRNLLDAINLHIAISQDKPKPELLPKETNDKVLTEAINKSPTIKEIEALLAGFQLPLSSPELMASLPKLLQYCVAKEVEEGSKSTLGTGFGAHPEKRKCVYKVFAKFFTATTSTDFVDLLKLIQNSIKTSRNKGKSRESEFALVEFRDALLVAMTLPNSPTTFDANQLREILDAISYKDEKTGDADVSKHTLRIIDKLEKITEEEKLSLQVTHITRLLLEIPDKINGEEINKAEYCFNNGGLYVVNAINALLKNPKLIGEDREKISVSAYVWNKHMKKLNHGREDIQGETLRAEIGDRRLNPQSEKPLQRSFPTQVNYEVDAQLPLDYEMIAKHKLLPKEFLKEATAYAASEVGKNKSKGARDDIRILLRDTEKPVLPTSSSPLPSSSSPPLLSNTGSLPSTQPVNFGIIKGIVHLLIAPPSTASAVSLSAKLGEYDNAFKFGMSHRKTTTEFVRNLLNTLGDKSNNKEYSDILGYNFLFFIRALLEAQASTGETETSKLLAYILPPLEIAIGISSTETKISSQRIQEVISKIDSMFNGVSNTFIFSDANLKSVIQKSFQYCAKNELQKGSHEEKIVSVYDILHLACFASSPIDFVNVFETIATGIQNSRKKGGQGENSRGAELALAELRDTLIEFIFKSTPPRFTFTTHQLSKILTSISYKTEKDAEVSKHALKLVELLYAPPVIPGQPLKPTAYQVLYNETATQLFRLILEIPDEINGEKINKAQYCYEKGSEWARAFERLLADDNFKGDRDKLQACAFVWNMRIEEITSKTSDLINVAYLDLEAISKCLHIPQEYREKALRIQTQTPAEAAKYGTALKKEVAKAESDKVPAGANSAGMWKQPNGPQAASSLGTGSQLPQSGQTPPPPSY
jgi:hypothetical protein